MGNDCCKDDTKERYRLDEPKKANAEIEKLKHRLGQMEAINQKHQTGLENQSRKHGEEVNTFKRQLNEYEREKARHKQRVSSMNQELKELTEENENLKTRLSAAIGARVRDGNPNIADLSDINRPINLSNDYSELYDNKWTDAYDAIAKITNMSEKDTCLLLCNIFCEIYKVCVKKADEDLEQLKNVMLAFYGVESTEMRKQFKDKRKEQHVHGKKKMEKEVMERVKILVRPETLLKSAILAAYIDECLRIAWLMSIQDPPVCVDTNMSREGEKFDTNILKAYTKSGTEIDFIVWPAVYLAKGQGLLAKGVAQGRQQVTLQQTPLSSERSFEKVNVLPEQKSSHDTTKGQNSSPTNQEPKHTNSDGQQSNPARTQHQISGNQINPGDSQIPTQAKARNNPVKSQIQEKSQHSEPVKKKHETSYTKPSTAAVQQKMNRPPKASDQGNGQSEQHRMPNTRGHTQSAQKQHCTTKYGEWAHKTTAPIEQQTEGTHSQKSKTATPHNQNSVKTVIPVGPISQP